MVEEIDDTLIFDDEDIDKYLTATEASILEALHQKIFDGKKNNDVECRIKNRVFGMLNQRSTYLLRFDYNSVDVVEVEDNRQTGGEPYVDIFKTYPKK